MLALLWLPNLIANQLSRHDLKVRTSNHSRIEKRRRDKLNAYITEISDLVPGCSTQSPRLDKLTVLRLALQHIKKFLTADREWKSLSDIPKFFAQVNLEQLCENAVDGFCMAVLRDRGRIVHISEAAYNYLSIRKDELMNHSIYDLLHPKDVQNFKKQIYFESTTPSKVETKRPFGADGRDISEADSSVTSCEPIGPSCEGQSNSGCARSSLNSEFSSLPAGGPPTHNHLTQLTSTDNCVNYVAFHCTGFLQCFTIFCGDKNEQVQERNSAKSVYLFFVARPLETLSEQILQEKNADFEFIVRLLVDGTVISADFGCACVIGLPSQDIVGTRYYNHVCSDDWQISFVAHRSVLQSTKCHSCSYRLKTAKHGMVFVSAVWSSFTNPWTKNVQYLIVKHSLSRYNNSRYSIY
ncbi:PAS 11 and HLH and PAS domain containing protein [Trichuris trichiura]|uniref:PAS 11 and HLH and PAS domain containing protein n=1 Tax=Trichuris trichiura TaxID=36087 RepID=A0A077YZS5_TRITR|nr:PAS 11 and HLH and PAS domain containing protein [Trichuris trichiura]